MSFDKLITDLIEAVNKNTEALKAGGGKGGSSSSGSSSNSTAQKHTKAEMQAVLQELKEKKSADDAKKVIKETGGVAKMADIPDDKIDAVYDAAKKILAKVDDEM